jgi:hypothetical protein
MRKLKRENDGYSGMIMVHAFCGLELGFPTPIQAPVGSSQPVYESMACFAR